MPAIQTTVRYTQVSREQVKEEAQEDQKIKGGKPMSPKANLVNVVVRLDKGDPYPDELAQLTGDLRMRLEILDVESVDFVREPTSRQGNKMLSLLE